MRDSRFLKHFGIHERHRRPAVAVVDQIRAISKQRLLSVIGHASPAEIGAVAVALKQILELP